MKRGKMTRSEIKQLIESIMPSDDLETSHRQDAIDWIESGAPLFRIQKPDKPPKHLVSYFAIVDRKIIRFSFRIIFLLDYGYLPAVTSIRTKILHKPFKESAWRK